MVCSTVQFLWFCDYLVRIIGHNHGLHAFCFVKTASVTARYKDGNHRVKGVFPTKGQTCYQHDGSIYQEEILPTFLPVFLSNEWTDDICTSARNIVTERKTNPKPMTTPQRALMMGSSVKVITGTIWIKRELMDTVIKVRCKHAQSDTKPKSSTENY